MNYIAHATAGIGAALIVSQVATLNPDAEVLLYAASTLGALLPDIDHPKAKISKYVPIIPDLLYNTVGHRTLTHSLLFAVVISALGFYFAPVVGIGLGLGIVSHIILDLFGYGHGVAFLYPFYTKRINIKA